jgi:hypothetical protein
MVWFAIYLVGWAVSDGANVSQDILVTIQCVEGEVAAELERRDTWLSAIHHLSRCDLLGTIIQTTKP